MLEACSDGWYDQSGAKLLGTGYEVRNWNANGAMLMLDNQSNWVVRSSDGTLFPVQGLPATGNIVFSRSHAAGFWLVREDYPTDERWFVDSSGAASLDGTFPHHLAGTQNHEPPVLDGDGVAYDITLMSDLADAVQRRTLDGQVTSVYSEDDRSKYCPEASVQCLFVMVHISHLITGP